MSHVEGVLLGGLILGLLFGAIGQQTGFCLLRGLKNQWVAGDGRKLRAFTLAMAVALLGTQVLAVLAPLDLSASIYPQRTLSLLLPLGGVLFGLGMVMANGCGARSLVLLGTGNLRSLVVLLCLGVAAYMTMSGVLANPRLALEGLVQFRLPAGTWWQWLAGLGMSPTLARWLFTVVLVTLLAGFALTHAGFRRSGRDLAGGLLIGLLIPAGWWVTGVLGDDIFDPVRLASLTFVAPVGDTLQYLMISTGISLTFPVTVVTGIVLGSLAAALLTGGLQWQGFESPRHIRRSSLGGLLMGIGGVMALGCSIGQGLTGFSTLAISAWLAFGGIVLGAWLGLKPLKNWASP